MKKINFFMETKEAGATNAIDLERKTKRPNISVFSV